MRMPAINETRGPMLRVMCMEVSTSVERRSEDQVLGALFACLQFRFGLRPGSEIVDRAGVFRPEAIPESPGLLLLVQNPCQCDQPQDHGAGNNAPSQRVEAHTILSGRLDSTVQSVNKFTSSIKVGALRDGVCSPAHPVTGTWPARVLSTIHAGNRRAL